MTLFTRIARRWCANGNQTGCSSEGQKKQKTTMSLQLLDISNCRQTTNRLRRPRLGVSRAFNAKRARRVIPLPEGVRVFPEAQPREWAASADSSSEWLGNNSGLKTSDFRGIQKRKEIRLGAR